MTLGWTYVALGWTYVILDWVCVSLLLNFHVFFSCYQSGYFASMFSGNWTESHLNTITIDITDTNISQECEW